MDPTAVPELIDLIGAQMVGVIGALVPVGQALVGSVLVLSIVFMGVSISAGASHLSSIMRVTALATITLYALETWPQLVLGSLDAARSAIGLVTGGDGTPSSGLAMGTELVERMALQAGSWNPLDWPGSVLIIVCALLVWLSLAICSLVQLIAEAQLLLAAAAAPLVLPFLALGFTSGIGASPLHFLLRSAVKVVVVGVTQAMVITAVHQLVDVAGLDAVFGTGDVFALLGLSMLAAVLCVGSGSLATGLTSGHAGGGGVHSAQSAGNIVQGAAMAGSAAAGGVIGAAGSAAKAGGAYAGSAARSMGSLTRSSGTGSAFS